MLTYCTSIILLSQNDFIACALKSKKNKKLFIIKKTFKMEHLKKFLGAALVFTAGFAIYDLLVKPLANKAKTAMPMGK